MIMLNSAVGGIGAAKLPLFKCGQLVRHRRYGYRGVVADFDPRCCADDVWYKNNNTQPKRDQPWYHVLVHDTSSATYAAEDSLILDNVTDPINHPMIGFFFSAFEHGLYERNDQPWIGW